MDKELLLKYIAGKASQKEKEDVATWIDADAGHRRILKEDKKDNFIASCYTTNLADCGSVCRSFRIKLCNDTGSPKRGYRNADCLCASRTTHIRDTC